MEPAKRIIVNTLAQHTRSVVNICLSLYSTRLVLQALGQSDYGIFALVSGVVAMLGFLTNAMVVTTQRQLSYYYGKGSVSDVRRMFSNSLLLHILLGVLLTIALMALERPLFGGFLKIDAARMLTATKVYYLVILSLLITFFTSPFRALFIARENIVYISIVDILDGIIKLLAALWLLHCPYDRLIAYSWLLAGIMAFNFVALSAWALTHFEESLLLPRLSDINKASMKELTNFAGWTVYSLGCIIGRNQGMAVILNRFFGTIVNASYGIAQQMFGSLLFMAQSVINAMSPQIIKMEGAGNRQAMLLLSGKLCKYSFFTLSMVVIPLVFEMPFILQLWLGEIPEGAVLLGRFVIISAVIDQFTLGLNVANQATGNIKVFALVVNTAKLMTLPLAFLALLLWKEIEVAMWCFLLVETACMLIRIPLSKAIMGLSVRAYFHQVVRPVLLPTLSAIAVCWLAVSVPSSGVRFLLTFVLSVSVQLGAIWLFGLENEERAYVLKLVKERRHG